MPRITFREALRRDHAAHSLESFAQRTFLPAAEHVKDLIGARRPCWTGELALVSPDEQARGVCGSADWNGRELFAPSVIIDWESMMDRAPLDATEAQEWADSALTVLHELLHHTVPEGETFELATTGGEDCVGRAREDGYVELAAGMLAPDVIGRMGVSPEVAAAVPSRLTYQFLLEAARREALDLAVMSGRPYRDVVVQIAAHGPARKSQEIAAIALSGMGDIARRLPTGADRDHCVRRIAAVLDEGWSRVEAGAGVNDGQEELLLDIGQRRCAGLDQLWQELDRQVPRPSAVAIFQTPPLILGDGNERAAHPIHARIAGTLVGHVALLSAHPEDQMAVELKMMAPERRVAWLTDVLVRSRLECYMKDVPRVFLNHHRSQINDTIEQALRQAVDLPYRLDGGSAPAVVRVEEDLRNGLDAAAGALHGYWSLRSRRGAGMLRRQPSRHADSQGEALAR